MNIIAAITATGIISNYQPLLFSRRSDLVSGSCRLFAGPSKNSLLNRGLTIGMQMKSNLQSKYRQHSWH